MSDAFSVLICDASDLTRQGLSIIIGETPNFTVVGIAASGLASVEQAIQLAPNLVVMDITMPDMDGIRAMQAIKNSVPNSKVLVLTDQEDDKIVKETVAKGADSFCLKNRPVSLLREAMEATLNGACWLDPGVGMRMMRIAELNTSARSTHTRLVRVGASGDRFRLSPREHDVLNLLVQGLSNRDIAGRLLISMDTVKTHVSHIMEKLEVTDRTQAAVKAVREQLL